MAVLELRPRPRQYRGMSKIAGEDTQIVGPRAPLATGKIRKIFLQCEIDRESGVE
jgi:hypothetical protein